MQILSYFCQFQHTEEDGRHFADDNFKFIFWNENCLTQIPLNFVPKDPINDILALVQIIWTNGGLVYWHLYASVGLTELYGSFMFTSCYNIGTIICLPQSHEATRKSMDKCIYWNHSHR